MFLRIADSPRRLIAGLKHSMSFTNNTTPLLFRSFMPRRNEIVNRVNTDTLCVQNYPEAFFQGFNPNTVFEKWAAVEVTESTSVPDGMETMTIPEGKYAVFLRSEEHTSELQS